MTEIAALAEQVQNRFNDIIDNKFVIDGELTIEIAPRYLKEVCLLLRDEAPFRFEQLMDLCAVDYLSFGLDEWMKEETTNTGFSRGVDVINPAELESRDPRFAIVYHLLSITNNQRIRIRVFPEGEPPMVESVISIWNSADWFEREAFDLFGILFKGHPDLRRILTDYGFIGHPFRKDYPLIGQVEMRYDATAGRCIYEAVSIQPRVLVPKVIRNDNRYNAEIEYKDEVNG